MTFTSEVKAFVSALDLPDEDKCVVTAWSHRGEASYHYETTGSKELEALLERINESEHFDITGVSPLNGAQDFGTGLELGGELW